MQQPEPEKHPKPKPRVERPKAKSEDIMNWENEGGNVIPTGALPRVVLPDKKTQARDK